MGTARKALLWLARERPRSPSPLLRGLTRTILWLLPITVLALVVARAVTTPVPPAGDLGTPYPDLCAATPAASVTALVGTSAYTARMLDRDRAECEWRLYPDDPRTSLDVQAERVRTYSYESESDAVRTAFADAVDLASIPFDDVPAEPLPGLGDEAVRLVSDTDGITEATVVVRLGKRILTLALAVRDRPLETVRPLVEDLARTLLPLLPKD